MIAVHPFNEYNIDSKYPAVKHSEESVGHKICFKITIGCNVFSQFSLTVGTPGFSRLHLIDIIQQHKTIQTSNRKRSSRFALQNTKNYIISIYNKKH